MGLIISTVNMFFHVISLVFFARVILSWFPMVANNRLMELLYALTEPILVPIRKLLHRSPIGGPGMMIDFSIIIALILLRFVQGAVISFLLII